MSFQQARRYTISALLLWLGSALAAGGLDILTAPGEPPIAVGLFFALPLLFFGALYFANTGFHAFANSISLPWIVAAHVWRFVGIGFVIAVFVGRLPAGFGIPEGLGDAVAAVFALPLALALHWEKAVRGYFIAWNVFGLIDLLSAIAVGVLYSEGSWGLLRSDVSTAAMTTFPVSIIPTFFVPLFILLHLLALARRNEVEAPQRSGIRFAEEMS